MGAGKSTLGPQIAQALNRRFVDLDLELERSLQRSIPEIFEQRGEVEFRILESEAALSTLRNERPAVVALGGGAVETPAVRRALAQEAFAVLLEVEADVAWERVQRSTRPLARDAESFRALHARRAPLYAEVADARAVDVDGAILAAGGVEVSAGAVDTCLRAGHAPAALVSDRRVLSLHGNRVRDHLGDRLVSLHQLPEGEGAKVTAEVERLWRELRLDREGTLVALGGGSVTDAAGFAAATYLRGIDWIAIPTTLVGQVDAAIGGKTAINLPQGKNLAGAFHWPIGVAIDPGVLSTLSPVQRREGMAEVVKTGLLCGEPVWELRDDELVRRCAAYKTAVCLRDPQERGERAVLNLGHTFAHALEAAADFALSHGDAVALGLLAALRLSGQPTDLVEEALAPKRVRVDRRRAWEALQRDKKRRDGRIRLVLLEAPGEPRYDEELPDADLRAALDELIAD